MLNFHNGAKSINEKSLFKKQHWENWIYTCKRMKCRPYQTSYAKKKLKMEQISKFKN